MRSACCTADSRRSSKPDTSRIDSGAGGQSMLSVNVRSVRCPGVNRQITEFAVKKLFLTRPKSVKQTKLRKTRSNLETSQRKPEKTFHCSNVGMILCQMMKRRFAS